MDVYPCRKSQRIYKRLLELISEFNKVERYKVNLQKSITYLHIINEQLEIKILKITI